MGSLMRDMLGASIGGRDLRVNTNFSIVFTIDATERM